MDIFTSLLEIINWVDLLIVICCCRTIYMGFTRGFTEELPRLLSVVGVIVLTYYNYSRLGQFLPQDSLMPQEIACRVAFVSLVIALALFFKLLCVLSRLIIKVSGPALFERVAGVILGGLRGLLLASILLSTLKQVFVSYVAYSIESGSWLGSKVAGLSAEIYNWLSGLITGA